MPAPDDDAEYFAGRKLRGDDLSSDEAERWLANQQEAYADLGAKDRSSYRYGYHALDILHGYRHLPAGRFERVLGIGSAYGDEFAPIKDRIGELVIVDPSDAFAADRVLGIPARYIKPRGDGRLDLPDASFDLITCFAVLQHIPKVTPVLHEMYRCLRPGGRVLIRDAIISLGDWRHPRPGVTPEQRGIPLPLFRERIAGAGFTVLKETKCMFALTSRLNRLTGASAYNSRWITRADRMACALFGWNTRYHRVRMHEKLGPWSVYYVLTK
jgi:SAM-dependent methyltransferase